MLQAVQSCLVTSTSPIPVTESTSHHRAIATSMFRPSSLAWSHLHLLYLWLNLHLTTELLRHQCSGHPVLLGHISISHTCDWIYISPQSYCDISVQSCHHAHEETILLVHCTGTWICNQSDCVIKARLIWQRRGVFLKRKKNLRNWGRVEWVWTGWQTKSPKIWSQRLNAERKPWLDWSSYYNVRQMPPRMAVHIVYHSFNTSGIYIYPKQAAHG